MAASLERELVGLPFDSSDINYERIYDHWIRRASSPIGAESDRTRLARSLRAHPSRLRASRYSLLDSLIALIDDKIDNVTIVCPARAFVALAECAAARCSTNGSP